MVETTLKAHTLVLTTSVDVVRSYPRRSSEAYSGHSEGFLRGYVDRYTPE